MSFCFCSNFKKRFLVCSDKHTQHNTAVWDVLYIMYVPAVYTLYNNKFKLKND